MIGFKEYHAVGFPVIGIYPMDHDRNCTCERPDCQAAGKHPIMSNWQSGIIWEDDQLENMREFGQLNSFGILVDGYLIVDIDPRNGGNDGYDALCQALDMELSDESGFVVNTGGGGKHIYYKLPDGVKLKSHDKRFKGIDFKSSGFVIGCGSFHKSGNFYEAEHGCPEEIAEPPHQLIELLQRTEREEFALGSDSFSLHEIQEMLNHINCGEDYEDWIRIGMAIHEATDGNGFDLWDAWSSRFSKYDPTDMDYHWHSYGKGQGDRVTAATLVHLAEEGGWVRSVTFEASPEEIAMLEKLEKKMALGVGECPVDYKSVDVRYPPGFVGKLTEWINRNCAEKREYISALAAIHAASMICGASSDIYLTNRKAVPNLFSIGIAGSGSGKGDVLAALQKIIDCSGLSKTVAGKIRSERAIYEGLAANQMFNLIMDEIGIKLGSVVGQKVSEYNMATAGALMEAYTAEILYCDQRITEEYVKQFEKRLSGLLMMIEENELQADPVDIKRQFDEVITRIDGAIRHPFFSMFGVSTDDQFKKLITEENIKSGLMGRAMIMQELQEIADENENVDYCDIPMPMQMTIKTIINGNSAGHKNWTESIISNKERRVITATPEVSALAKEFFSWLKMIARQHVENGTGYQPLINRCAVKVAKIAGVLACDTGLITMEHLRYAVALTIKSTSDLMMRADSLSGAASKSNDRRIEGLESLVREYVKRGMARKAIIIGVAKDGNYKRADSERMLDKLIEEGQVVEDKEAKRTSNRAIIYKLTNDEVTI